MVLHPLLGGKNAGSPLRRSKKIRRRATRGQIWALRPRCEVMEDRTLLATMLWAAAASGDWDVASNWVNSADSSNHHVPTASDDAQVNFSGITVTHATSADTVNSLTSQASLNLSGGSLSLAATSVISGSFAMSGGTLTGSGNLTVTGPTTWTGGTMSGSGITDAQGGLTIGGTGTGTYNENLSGRTLENDATATLSISSPDSPNGLDFYNGATLINEPGASFSVTTDTSIANGNGVNTFVNEGTFAKTGGTSSPVSVTFNQSSAGTTLAESGALQLNGGETFAGRVEATGGGSLKMAIAPTNLTAGTLTGATWSVGANSAIFIDGDITTDAANIILDGASSQIIDQNGNDALANLADISAGGGFTIENGRNFTAALGLSNAGNITIGAGSTLTGNLYQVGGQTSVLGTLNGVSTSLTPPDPGSALAFNGVSDYATVPDQPSLRLNSTVTIEFWARRERFGLDIVLEKGGDWTEGTPITGSGLIT